MSLSNKAKNWVVNTSMVASFRKAGRALTSGSKSVLGFVGRSIVKAVKYGLVSAAVTGVVTGASFGLYAAATDTNVNDAEKKTVVTVNYVGNAINGIIYKGASFISDNSTWLNTVSLVGDIVEGGADAIGKGSADLTYNAAKAIEDYYAKQKKAALVPAEPTKALSASSNRQLMM